VARSTTPETWRACERWGYRRIWVAEHHNNAGIASAATSIVIAHMAAGSKTIRVGAGGIMLPNHSPYVIAEQFGTAGAAVSWPHRTRSRPRAGTDRLTLRALRRAPEVAEHFIPGRARAAGGFSPRLAGPAHPGRTGGPARMCRSGFWAPANFGRCCAELGLPYAFCLAFCAELLIPALQNLSIPASSPSEQLGRPYAMVGVHIIAAPTDSEARRLGDDPTKCRRQHFSCARGLSNRRSTTSKPFGPRRRRRRQCACSRVPSWVLRSGA